MLPPSFPTKFRLWLAELYNSFCVNRSFILSALLDVYSRKQQAWMNLLKSSSSYILHKQETARIQMRLLKIPKQETARIQMRLLKINMTVISQIIANNNTWDYTITSQNLVSKNIKIHQHILNTNKFKNDSASSFF